LRLSEDGRRAESARREDAVPDPAQGARRPGGQGDRHPRIVGHPATENPGSVVLKRFTRGVAAVFPAGMSPIANGGIQPEVIV